MTTEYAGNYVYEGGSLQFFNQSEGYIEPDGSGGYDYIYQHKDHLGNIRLSYSDDVSVDGSIDPGTEIREENNYYPFGLKHKGYNAIVNGRNHKYGFGGKEEQDELDLKWLDFSARNYDAALGRWMNLDPLAEQMRRHSPYNYAFDNPVFFVDYDGMRPCPNGEDCPPLERIKAFSKGVFQGFVSNLEFDTFRQTDYTSEKPREGDGDSDVEAGREAGETLQEIVEIGVTGIAGLSRKVLQKIGQKLVKEGLEETGEKVAKKTIVKNNVDEVGNQVTKFSQESADDLVKSLKDDFGGNVTVMKDGKPVFRVHQPGTHGQTNSSVTTFRQGTNPKTGDVFNIPSKKVSSFTEEYYNILNQATRGEGGFSIVTKGGR
ncbi:MAG: RHS repeat domain-containing protein [Flavobacteriaceae bacterium]